MIHYHGLPMTPESACVTALRAKHAMVSFADARQIALATEICQSVVLDNGAFSAWKGGRALEWALSTLFVAAVEEVQQETAD